MKRAGLVAVVTFIAALGGYRPAPAASTAAGVWTVSARPNCGWT